MLRRCTTWHSSSKKCFGFYCLFCSLTEHSDLWTLFFSRFYSWQFLGYAVLSSRPLTLPGNVIHLISPVISPWCGAEPNWSLLRRMSGTAFYHISFLIRIQNSVSRRDFDYGRHKDMHNLSLDSHVSRCLRAAVVISIFLVSCHGCSSSPVSGDCCPFRL